MTRSFDPRKLCYFVLLIVIASIPMLSLPAAACSCTAPPPGVKTPCDLAAWRSKRGDAVFEARVERIPLKWSLADARIGDLVPAIVDDLDDDVPHMIVSMEVSRWYRGGQSDHVQVRTRLGGADGGFEFEIGKKYLVYASKEETGELSTGICSGTALLEDSRANLAYLRGESIPEDSDKPAPRLGREVCGHATLTTSADFTNAEVLLLRPGSNSPVPYAEADPDEHGAFCITDVAPGTISCCLSTKLGNRSLVRVFSWRFPAIRGERH